MRVTRAGPTRLDAATGLVAGALFLVGFGLPGNPPSPDEPTAAIAEFLADHRSAILAGDLLVALAAAAFVWFLGVLRGHLADAGEEHLSTAAILGGAVSTAIITAGAALQAGLVLNLGEASDDVVRFGFDGFNALITIAGAPLAAAVAATSLSASRSGALPAWVVRAGLVTAVLQLLTLPGLIVESGLFAAGEAMALAAFIAVVAWFVAVSVVLIRRS